MQTNILDTFIYQDNACHWTLFNT